MKLIYVVISVMFLLLMYLPFIVRFGELLYLYWCLVTIVYAIVSVMYLRRYLR